ncbi:MAG: flagellar basal body P-ring formation chaperone FlgA [Pseudomonadota bacterium]
MAGASYNRRLRAACASIALFAASTASGAETALDVGALFAARTIPAGALISPADVKQSAKPIAGALTKPEEVVGREARVALYAGRAILRGDVRDPALVDRNQMVVMRFSRGPLAIRAEGRALDRGAAGERVRVMNLSSRNVVSGVVLEDGDIAVGAAR